MVCIKTYYASSLSKPSRWPKTQVPKTIIFLKPPWLMPWGMLTKITQFLGTLLSRNPLLDRNDINNFGPKGYLSKTIPILRSDASIWKAFYGTCRCPEQMSQKKWKKNKRKNDCHVMHLKNSIKPKWESRMSKNAKKKWSFPSCKESLFSLGNYVWDEKWPSFIILSLI